MPLLEICRIYIFGMIPDIWKNFNGRISGPFVSSITFESTCSPHIGEDLGIPFPREHRHEPKQEQCQKLNEEVANNPNSQFSC